MNVHCRAVVTAAVTAALALPAAAAASTVSIATDGTATFTAAAGEVNEVTLHEDVPTGALVVADAGAALTPGQGCTAVTANRVRCDAWEPPRTAKPDVAVTLGDGHDTLVVDQPGGGRASALTGLLAVDAGAGDDVVDARYAIQTALTGGTGDDRLRAGALAGQLDGGEGDDVLEGGPNQHDLVTYRGRTERIVVDLADRKVDGARGERDVIRRIEDVEGGTRRDRLSGDKRSNALLGGPGRDRLAGRGGGDVIGSPPLAAFGTVTGSARGDDVDCGGGRDALFGRATADYTAPSCETIEVRRALPEGLGSERGVLMDPYPDALRFEVPCSEEEDLDDAAWKALRCEGTVRLRDARGRLLAKGTVPRGGGHLSARLRPTALGARLAARPRGVLARVSFRGDNLPIDGWTIRWRG